MSRRWLPACVALLGVVLGAVSCKGDSEKEEPATPYQKFMGSYIDELCVALAPCCSGIPFDVGSCQDFLGFAIGYEAAGANPKLFTFHQDRADQCLADLKSAGVCSGDTPPSCDLVTEGTLAPGAVCGASVECNGSPGLCESDANGSFHCAYPARPGMVGEACTTDCPPDSEPCSGDVSTVFCYPSQGLHCTNGTCQPLPPVGAPCSGFECDVAGYCNGSVCVARAAPGAACSGSGSDTCTSGNYCASGVCTAQLPAGAPCDATGFSDQCGGGSLGGICDDSAHCISLGLELLCAFGAIE